MANSIYPNVVLENKFESVLTTALNLQNYLTVDNSLQEEAGMRKRIISKTVSGSVEDLAQGVGNTENIEVATSYADYEVGTTQARFPYFDEEAMADANLIEAGLQGLSEKMVNSFVAKAVAEWEKATLQQGYSSISFDTVVDAIAKMNLEDESKLFMLISPNMVAAFRKAVKDELKYSEDFVRTGYLGSIVGVPCYVCKAIPNGEAIIADKSAVRLFLKKNTEIEQEREPNTRKNTVYCRKVALVALVDARKVVKIGANQATTATITTKAAGAKAIAGAATTGATVKVYINGVYDGEATAASSAYSYTAKANLVAGDEIKVVAVLTGCVDSIVTATAA